MLRVAPLVLIVGILAVPALSAYGALTPLNDLLSLGQGGGQEPTAVPVRQPAEPSMDAAPRPKCGAGSHPEPGIQGRVPAGAANGGLDCNADLVSHQGTSGGFKVLRYVDPAGHECAFYDTALLFPTNAFKLDATSQGVAVLDMSNPAHPVQTDTLTDPSMLSPHESLNLNERRGLLASVLGNPSTYPGLVSIYDVRSDCRHPKLQSSSPVARLGHESGFSPDGNTFYATGTAVKAISAIDVTNPKEPHSIWQGNIMAHGMSLSDDGNRAYVADPIGGDMLILDTSEIQARKPNPQAREISRLTWKSASIPQNAMPFTVKGKPYVLEFDEYTAGASGRRSNDDVGAARIIDISDERAPRVVSNIRLQVNQPADHRAAGSDPGALSPVQGYAAHYCNIPTRVDPKVVACSFIASGLRVFDISDLVHPKEIAYYVAPTKPRTENGMNPSSYAMSRPAFAPDRREVWYSDGGTGFYNVRVAASVWPGSKSSPSSGTGGRGCLARRSPLGPHNIGRVKIGLTRKALLRRVPAPRGRTARSWRWCVKGGRGTVSAAFTKHGRVALVTSTSPRYGNRRVFPGGRTSSLRRSFPRGHKVGTTIVRANPRSPRIFGIRRGRVRYVAVAPDRTLARPKTLRAYLRYAGVVVAAAKKKR